MERIAIFFDTNKLEARFTDHKCGDLCLADIKASTDFYDIRRFVNEYQLSDKIEFCIPELVILEYKRHLLDIYTQHTESFRSEINEYQKVFGSILKVDFEFVKQNVDEFKEHIDALFNNFIAMNNCKVIEYDRSSALLERIVDKAINRVAPFVFVRCNKKEYHDAGLKDAIIAETILKYHVDNDCPCILISEDNDWGRCSDLNKDDIFICKNLEQLRIILHEKLGITDIDEDVRLKFEDSYIRETIIRETGNQYDSAVSDFNVVAIMLKNANIYTVKINCNINETIYWIVCEYDYASNEVSSVSYEIENE